MSTRDSIIQAALANGVDPNLALAVAQKESGFNQNLVSSAGAIGVFQLMPGTAHDMGVNPYDETQNIQGGVQYLKQQLDTFGSTDLALAAYNAGPGNVEKYGGIPPFGETQSYVSDIMSSLGDSNSSSSDGSWIPLALVALVGLAFVLGR